MNFPMTEYESGYSLSPNWLTVLPGHWRTGRLTMLVDLRTSNVDKKTYASELPVKLCNYVDVYKNSRITNSLPFMTATASDHEIERFRLNVGDVLVTKDSEAWNDIGVPSLVTEVADDLVCGYHLALLRPNDELSGPYLYWALNSGDIAHQFHVQANGVTRYGLANPAFQSVRLPLPPLPEQRAIAKYLDYMDRRIQRYIEAKEGLIGLLEEQKRVVINEAVTRGLDPDVRLKASGVEWLGDVPAHWEVRRLKFLATKFGSGVTPRGGAAVYKETGIPLLRSQNVHFDGLRLDGVARIDPELHDELSASHVMGGDVLLNVTGASIGRTCAVPEGFEDGNVNQHVCIIRPRRDAISSAFLTAFLSTSFIQRRIRNELGGASREGLTLQSIRDFEVLVPPLDEQHRINDYIQERSSESLGMCSRTLKQIELIKEYRTRLIADVVTGKLDVREAAAELGDEMDEDELSDRLELSGVR